MCCKSITFNCVFYFAFLAENGFQLIKCIASCYECMYVNKYNQKYATLNVCLFGGNLISAKQHTHELF